MMRDDSKFIFSVIVPIYNVENYLAEAVDSVIAQDIGFQNCQLILVDDGSSDGSGAVCDRYAEKHPANIVVVHRPNAGASAARNTGLQLAEGRYIHMLDPDDRVSPDAYSAVCDFFRQHEDEVDIVDIPTVYFEAVTGTPAWCGPKFDQGSRVIDLMREYRILQCRVGFYKTGTARRFRFNTELRTAEDLDFNLRILIGNPRLGSCAKGLYCYRRRADGASLVDLRRRWEDTYARNTEAVTLAAFRSSREKYGEIPRFVQSAALCELASKLNMPIGTLIGNEGERRFLEAADKALAEIDDEVILKSCVLRGAKLLWLMCRKHHQPPEIVPRKSALRIAVDGTICGKLNKRFLLRGAEISPEGGLVVTGECFLLYGREAEFSVSATSKPGVKIEAEKLGDETISVLGDGVYTRRTVSLRLPRPVKAAEYRLDLNYGDREFPFELLVRREDFPGHVCRFGSGCFTLTATVKNRLKVSWRSWLRHKLSVIDRWIRKRRSTGSDVA